MKEREREGCLLKKRFPCGTRKQDKTAPAHFEELHLLGKIKEISQTKRKQDTPKSWATSGGDQTRYLADGQKTDLIHDLPRTGAAKCSKDSNDGNAI